MSCHSYQIPPQSEVTFIYKVVSQRPENDGRTNYMDQHLGIITGHQCILLVLMLHLYCCMKPEWKFLNFSTNAGISSSRGKIVVLQANKHHQIELNHHN